MLQDEIECTKEIKKLSSISQVKEEKQAQKNKG